MSSSSSPAVEEVQHHHEDDGDWEEWDGRSPFWAHCVAGSLAGVMEHAAIYPLDTVRTHIQVCAACVQRHSNSPITNKFTSNEGGSSSLLRSTSTAAAANKSATTAAQQQRLPLGMWQTIRYLVSEPVVAAGVAERLTTSSLSSQQQPAANLTAGYARLFRGVQTILIGCVPAHALYFSSYEIVKAAFLKENGQVSTLGSSLAGAAAVTSHDLIMTPLDTLKQRLQIGHYAGARQAAQAICQQEGIIALYRSFPITLASNIPYGMVMVSTHEACKQALHQHENNRNRPHWQIVLAASSVAGFVASAVTTPLDRIKTALQTQQLTPMCARQQQPMSCPLQQKNLAAAAASVGAGNPKHLNWQQAAVTIWKEEGAAGFLRGMTPRILSHTPAVAISWTTYESAKHYLLSHY